jgi:hypothetical protein
METLNEFLKRGFEIATRNRLIAGLVGNDFNLFKDRLVYWFNVALVFAFSFFKLFYEFFMTLVSYVFTTLFAKEKVLNREIVLITGSGGYLGKHSSF